MSYTLEDKWKHTYDGAGFTDPPGLNLFAHLMESCAEFIRDNEVEQLGTARLFSSTLRLLYPGASVLGLFDLRYGYVEDTLSVGDDYASSIWLGADIIKPRMLMGIDGEAQILSILCEQFSEKLAPVVMSWALCGEVSYHDDPLSDAWDWSAYTPQTDSLNLIEVKRPAVVAIQRVLEPTDDGVYTRMKLIEPGSYGLMEITEEE